MNCPKCGIENSPHARFCQQCGFDIKSAAIEKPEQPVNLSAPSGEIPAAPSPAASNTGETPANPVQREEIIIPSPSTSAIPLQPSVAGVPVPPVAFSLPVSPQYAGFWLRVAAALIDGLILNTISFVIIFPAAFILGFFGAISRLPQSSIDSFSGILSFFGYVFGTFFSWMYYALMESSSKQATLGKMAVGIKVVGLDGRRISFGRATARYFSKLIPDFGIVTIWFTEKKQAIHDMIAGTLVVKK